MNNKPAALKVVAGILYRDNTQVLLGQRQPGKPMAGLWEFPGGKVEANESPHQALKRELREELGIDIIRSLPLMTVRHRYPELLVELQVREVLGWEGKVRSAEGQALRWTAVDKLKSDQMPAADAPVITALKLPRSYQITPECADVCTYLSFIERSLAQGSRFIQLRAKNLEPKQCECLIEQVRQLPGREQATILLNSACGNLQQRSTLDGWHLTSRHLRTLTGPLPQGHGLIAASCHNIEEIRRAEELGVDMICLSPVRETASHPEAKPLGDQGFERLCAQTNLPVYALGGLCAKDQQIMRELGAVGIAGIRAFEPY